MSKVIFLSIRGKDVHNRLVYFLMYVSQVRCRTLDTELIAYFAECMNYSEHSGLQFWVSNANKYPLLAPLTQDLLSAPASEAYFEHLFSVCGELTAGKRNRLTKSLEKRIMLKMNLKYYESAKESPRHRQSVLY